MTQPDDPAPLPDAERFHAGPPTTTPHRARSATTPVYTIPVSLPVLRRILGATEPALRAFDAGRVLFGKAGRTSPLSEDERAYVGGILMDAAMTVFSTLFPH
jgi:hypothetical protein